MPIRHKEPREEEPLNFDGDSDEKQGIPFGEKQPFRRIEDQDDETKSDILETDHLLSNLTNDAIATRKDIKKLTK